ncbi:DUF3471 domain-containing protein [Lacihabitans soyangensis]|uniref:DUF3471 domain-containing protein n=1 Tax=Lacihabitans soyangensis TaxID=869394 RepID=A0AAE3H1V3_9BACT|nr:DUF3471 domain-containing protein [Lacihabitans soyangensis]MCP9762725.1 DUF3471 domain-containing protein [Lacihabitans soyangensis]
MKKLFVIVLFLTFPLFVSAQNGNLLDYAGAFKFDGAPFEKIIISVEGSTLFAEAEGVGKGEIFPSKNKDEFTEPNNNAVLVFNRDGSGQVVSLTVKVQGSELKGTKQSDAKAEYLGKYKFADDSAVASMTVSLKDGELFGETDQGSAVLKSTDKKDIFNVVGYDGSVEFIRDSAGKVSKVILKVQDMVMNGEKQ